MVRKLRIAHGLFAVAIAVAGASLVVTPANAKPSRPAPPAPTGPRLNLPNQLQSDPAMLAKLTPEERKALAVIEFRHEATGVDPAQFETLRKAGKIALAGCSTYTDNLYAWNGTDDIWRWSLPVTWCWDGWQVTNIHPAVPNWHIYSWASVLGWSYEATVDRDQWDYYGDRWVYRSYAQGHFSYCPIRIGCLQHMYPYEYVDTYGDGGAGTAGWGGASRT